MNTGNARSSDPSAQGQQEGAPDPAAPTDQDEIVDAYDPLGGDDDGDDFEEFGKYGLMAAQARVKGGAKTSGVSKMRQGGDQSGARKLHKPEHKPKRDL